MADSNQLPSMLIESLKEEKEDRARIENIEKINVSLKDKQIKLSEEQTVQLITLRNSLESNSLQTLEDKREANTVASNTLGLLSDIKDNTEDLKFDFGSGKEGIAQKILVFGQLMLTQFAVGFIKGAASIFKFPTLKKLFSKLVLKPLKFVFTPVTKLFTYISSVFRAIGDVWKKAGTGRFLKGNTFKILGARGIMFLDTIFKRMKSIIKGIKEFGGKMKSIGGMIKGFLVRGVTRLLKPFKDIGKAFGAVVSSLKGLSGGKGPLSKIMGFIKTVGGLLDKFKVLFRAVGVGIGKLIFPVLAAIDFIRGIVDSLKTSTFTSPIAKAIDALLTGVGFAVGGFIGGLVDLIKDGISWLTEKLRFEGLSEWLDSFSLREMIERGFSDMAEFFSELFTDFLPALFEGIKAAAIPGGQSFNEAFQERLSMSGEEYKSKKELEESGAFDTSSRFKEKIRLQDKIAHEKEQIAEGDSKGGLVGFRYDRKARIEELQAEMDAVDDEIRKNQLRLNKLNGETSLEKISNISGAEMEATQNDTADAKATPVVAPTGVVANMQNIDNSSSSVVKTTNMNNHIDRTSMAAFAPAY